MYRVFDICGNYALNIDMLGSKSNVTIYFNSQYNAELVKSILEWEENHPNEAAPYKLQEAKDETE